MKCCQVQVYIAGREEGDYQSIRVAMSYHMALEEEELVKRGYGWYWPLTGSLSLYQGYLLVGRLKEISWIVEPISSAKMERWVRKVKYWFRKQKWVREWEIQYFPKQEPSIVCGTMQMNGVAKANLLQRQILALLRGRILFFSEIEKGLREMGLVEEKKQILANLIPLLIRERIEMIPSNLPDESFCQRCASKQLKMTQCGICGEVTWYCPECMKMGESLTCRPLFRRKDQVELGEDELFPLEIQYTFSLTNYQKKLSQYLEKGYQEKDGRDWLLWAVCGAGKTEITFEVIGHVLLRGGRVLFTSPRREVVKQMVERFQEAFPNVSLVGIYGGSEAHLAQGQLTVATVHQLTRFYYAFDLIVFDEVDAFPYQGDSRLKALVERSRKDRGRMIYLSATPNEELLIGIKLGRIEVLSLPARFHGKEVPVPKLIYHQLPKESEILRMAREVERWIDQSIHRDLAQLFIFLPTRGMVEEFGRSLDQFLSQKGLNDWVEYTHSQDSERSEKVKKFLKGDYPVLVTTTIMERGVTVPKCNVLVLYADYEQIFDHQSLIQMAGRAGRSQWAPNGHVWFVGRKVSKEMKKAREWILRMNEVARERGLLDGTDG